MEHVSRPESSREVPVSPRMIHMEAGVLMMSDMSRPFPVGMYVRRVGMTFEISKIPCGCAMFFRSSRCRTSLGTPGFGTRGFRAPRSGVRSRRRTARRNVSASNVRSRATLLVTVLGRAQSVTSCQNSDCCQNR
jgi:hypothetical protein